MIFRFLLIAGALFLTSSCGNDATNLSASKEEQQEEEKPTNLAIEKQEIITQDQPIFDATSYNIENGHVVLSWAELAKVDFKMQYSDELESEVPFPIFSEEMKALAGKSIQIKGYVIPVEETGDNSIIILSAFPYTQCFFCGAAGPESVMDILAEEKLSKLKMDDEVTFRGKLKLNDSDLDYLNYILEEAELVE